MVGTELILLKIGADGGLCEVCKEPPGSLKAICKSFYRRPPEAADSLVRPPWNVVQQCWMASAMAPEADLQGGAVSPRTDMGALGEFADAGMVYDSIG
ncbi:hypothetical protein ANN_00976 [Periplaneta americana]|uniref:Uncharacterized protein n=1 Tax=Periplaneta americana TaxID=6978 RepID=A0ABQ8TS96_PERAM|nr:hypothetical protein ANN_00976 [Periplaneta americana]